MRSIDPNVELVAATFQAPNVECFHLFFTGVDDARVHAKLLRPVNTPSPHPALLLFHGCTGDSGDWFDKPGDVAAGFTVATLDCRGQAGLSEDLGV
jgi:cephalosporin-C deacetylase